MGIFSTIGWIVAVVVAVLLIIDIWTKQKKMKQEHKILWTIGAVLLGINIIVGIVYYFVVKNK